MSQRLFVSETTQKWSFLDLFCCYWDRARLAAQKGAQLAREVQGEKSLACDVVFADQPSTESLRAAHRAYASPFHFTPIAARPIRSSISSRVG